MKVSSLLIGSWNLFLIAVVATLCLLPSLCQGQEYYEDYAQEQDNLYHDYAARHDAENSPAATAAGGGAGWGKVLMGTAAGWMVGGKFHSRRLQKKLNSKFKADQKALYQQYYNDVYALQQQNAELMAALEQYMGRRA